MDSTRNVSRLRLLRCVPAALGLALMGGVSASALLADDSSSVPRVGKIEFIVHGELDLSRDDLHRLFQVKAGDLYSVERVDPGIRALYRTGVFEFIDVKRHEAGPGLIDLSIFVSVRMRFGGAEFVGNEAISSEDLGRCLNVKVGEYCPYDKERSQIVSRMYGLYHERGFSDVAITSSVRHEPGAARVIKLIFTIREHPTGQNPPG